MDHCEDGFAEPTTTTTQNDGDGAMAQQGPTSIEHQLEGMLIL